MCISATVLAAASLVASTAGTVVSVASAQANKRAQQWQLDEQQKQLREEREIARMQAQEVELQRLSDFRRSRAANASALAASGLRENISFLQGVMPAEERALRLDLGAVRLGQATGDNRLASQIRVNRFSRDVAGFNAGMQTIGALAGFAGSVAGTVSSYQALRTPSTGGKVGSGTTDAGSLGFSLTAPGTAIPRFSAPRIGR